MKIELINNKKVILDSDGSKKEIHPFWLRERVSESEHLDPGTQQRLFDPATMNFKVGIDDAKLVGDYLNIKFNDGIISKFEIKKLSSEFLEVDNELDIVEKLQWDCSLKNIKNFKYMDGFFESKEMYDMLVSFYKYGFVIIKNVPTKNNFLINFGNSIGSVKRTNFGEHFDVKSKPNPNDLAYTSMSLAPHTDNPYRNPVPCIQMLQCIENKVSGGLSTLVDGYTVSQKLKKKFPDYYKILTEIKVRFQFVDNSVVLEDWSEMIQVDEDGYFNQV